MLELNPFACRISLHSTQVFCVWGTLPPLNHNRMVIVIRVVLR